MPMSHVIYRQILDISFSSREEALRAQDEISRVYRHDLLPLINEIFDDLMEEGESIRIESLELDLGPIPAGELREELVKRIKKKLEDELLKKIQNARKVPSQEDSLLEAIEYGLRDEVTMRSARLSDAELFIYFIKTGRLPWWARKSKFKSLQELALKLIKDQPDVLRILLKQQLANPNYSTRLVHQLPDHVLGQLLSLQQKGAGDGVLKLHTDLYAIHQHRPLASWNFSNFRLFLWRSAFDHWFFNRDHTSPGYTFASKKGTAIAKELDLPSSRLLISYMSYLVQKLVGPSGAAVNRKSDLLRGMRQAVAELEKRQHVFKTVLLKELLVLLSTAKPPGKDDGNKERTSLKPASDSQQITSSQTHSPSEADPKRHSPARGRILDDETFDIHNAGLVLLSPFLNTFFEALGLVQDKAFITPDAAQRAALLLEYAATRNTEVPEYDLILNKLLCGIDIEEPLPNHIDLGEVEIEEVGNLLGSVVTHWTALKATSQEGLRKTFLMKDGILSQEAQGWRLKIERSSVDILVDRLPWSISMIKLPWCKEILNVEW